MSQALRHTFQGQRHSIAATTPERKLDIPDLTDIVRIALDHCILPLATP